MTVYYLEATGNAGVGLTRHRERHDRMTPVLQFTTTDGRQFEVELTVADLKGIGHDIVQLFSASADEVASWWRTLADGSDGRPEAAAFLGTQSKTLAAQQDRRTSNMNVVAAQPDSPRCNAGWFGQPFVRRER